jgi:hypothetical protein
MVVFIGGNIVSESIKGVFLLTLFRFLESTLSLSQKLRSDMNSASRIYSSLYLRAFVRCTVYLALLLVGGVGVALSSPLSMPNSEMDYPGASANSAFVAKEPYVINIQGTMVTIPLWGASRRNDFSGNAPFVNPETGKIDPAQIQAWDSVFATSFRPPLPGSYSLNGSQITNLGFPGRVDKQTINGSAVTMVRYNAGDGITEGKCRSQLNAYAVPPRTHVRWELEVAFGNPDGVNDWVLTPAEASPVLFWQMHSMNQTNPPLAANVDTDESDPTKLTITFFQRVGTAAKPMEIARVNGISRYTMVPIVIEAFLDERATADGGKGLLQISVDNKLVLEKEGPTLAAGTNPHWWALAMYLWNDALPSQYTRASFWKTAKMIVFPVSTVGTIEPSGSESLEAIAQTAAEAQEAADAAAEAAADAQIAADEAAVQAATSAQASSIAADAQAAADVQAAAKAQAALDAQTAADEAAQAAVDAQAAADEAAAQAVADAQSVADAAARAAADAQAVADAAARAAAEAQVVANKAAQAAAEAQAAADALAQAITDKI